MNTSKKLAWFLASGITECISESPLNRIQKTSQTSDLSVDNNIPERKSESQDDNLLKQAHQLAERSTSIADLNQALSEFNTCPLKKTAIHTLIGRGITEQTKVMCIGDVPDTDDEKQAQIFSGEIGALLERMLNAIDLSLSKNAYVTNLIPWRPPGNRKPTPTEIALCLPFLKKQISLIKPKALLVFGNLSIQALTQVSTIPKARTQALEYTEGSLSIPLFATFHPALVLKMPNYRKFVWEDLQKLKKHLDT